MKIKRLIALSITAAVLAGGATFAQDTHFDGYTHNPIAVHNDQQSSHWNQKRDLKKEEQIRKKREQEEKKRIEREKKERQRAEANRKKKKSYKKPMPKPNDQHRQNQQNWPHF